MTFRCPTDISFVCPNGAINFQGVMMESGDLSFWLESVRVSLGTWFQSCLWSQAASYLAMMQKEGCGLPWACRRAWMGSRSLSMEGVSVSWSAAHRVLANNAYAGGIHWKVGMGFIVENLVLSRRRYLGTLSFFCSFSIL